MAPWITHPRVEVPASLYEAVGGGDLIAQALMRRGIIQAEAVRAFLDPSLYKPTPPDDLPGIEAAAERLLDAIQRDEPICVWGDFDVDGQTATTVLVTVLRDLGGQVSYYIPVRAIESHGVHPGRLKNILDAGARVILTCDTGIAAHEAAEYSRSRGVDFIITDHHELPAHLPLAHSITNPRLLPDGHALSWLPGVGVAYKLAEYLYGKQGSLGQSEQLLDLVALGIVADVAVLSGDNRYLLQRGLMTIRDGQRLGLQTLIEVAELNPSNITADHIGYVLGPRLNSIGRLGDANSVVELFTTQDQKRARILALELEGLNAQRQLLTSQVYQAAITQIQRETELLAPAVLVLAYPNWPAGILGIVANRLVEQYQKPVIMFNTDKDGPARGSARSIPGVNITQAIAEVAASSDVVLGFGGHTMAAGLSLQADRVPEFRTAISRVVSAMLSSELQEETLLIDAQINLSDINTHLVSEIERLAPFGPGNPPIVFSANHLTIKKHRGIGRNKEHLLLVVQDETGVSQKVMWWQASDRSLPEGTIDLAFTIHSSDYRGQPEIQVQWIDSRPSDMPPDGADTSSREILFQDFRGASVPLEILDQLRSSTPLAIWCEDGSKDQIGGKNRLEIAPAQVLVVWNSPPGRSELQAVMGQVKPKTTILFANNPEMDKPEEFLRHLAGLAKFTLNKLDGETTIDRLAAATAQRSSTVLAGLDWLSAAGKVSYTRTDNTKVIFSNDVHPRPGDFPVTELRLKTLLHETAAYRAYYARAPLEYFNE